tara:strand:- start:1161 stop:2345 length:1185 start_codon:yes stop_codon:yes gene_type:complete
MDDLSKEFLIKAYLSDQELSWLNKFSAEKKEAILELINFEFTSKKESRDTDLRFFDFTTNKTISEILKRNLSKNLKNNIKLDIRSKKYVSNIKNSLEKTGYSVGDYKITEEKLKELSDAVLSCKYASKDGEVILSGNQIINKQKKLSKNAGIGSDTFWLINQNSLLNKKPISDLLNDPIIMQSVSEYLGCAPILVQSNAWLSLPTMATSTNLNVNAQQFHQDKEFAKFIKVFVYLNDVDITNGAHSYIIESHIDELHKKGIPLSSRVSDKDIIRYYNKENIKLAQGKAGTVIFADTSCVHKGGLVSKGYRIMLQLEFTSSLYMSPVDSFDEVRDNFRDKLEKNLYFDTSRLLNNVDVMKYNQNVSNTLNQSQNKFSVKAKLKKYFYKILLPFLK